MLWFCRYSQENTNILLCFSSEIFIKSRVFEINQIIAKGKGKQIHFIISSIEQNKKNLFYISNKVKTFLIQYSYNVDLYFVFYS